MRTLWSVISMLFLSASCYSNPARETYRQTGEILKIVENIEEQLTKEERIREVTSIVQLDANVDKVNKKLDRVLSFLEIGNPLARMSSAPVAMVPRDSSGRLEAIDDRLEQLEKSVGKIEKVFEEVDFNRLKSIEEASTQLQEDMDRKLRKLMNVVSSLYDMSKEVNANDGARSGGIVATQADSTPNYGNEFLIENLEELERKIKEQFSVLTNDIRTEITSLKIMASSVSCDKQSDFDYDDKFDEKQSGPSKRASRKHSPRNKDVSTERSSGVGQQDILNTIVQSLGKTSTEIRQEIHQGIQTLDHKLENLTMKQQLCGGGDLEASASFVEPVKAVREINSLPERNLEHKKPSRKPTCTKVVRNMTSPKSCADLRRGGATCDGVYIIFPMDVRAVRVFCDMTTDGGGWTVLMRRGDYGDKMTTFHKNWLSYKNGFGDVEGEFWLGNDMIHILSAQDDNILQVRLEAFDGEDINITYTSFSVADEKDNYRLLIGPSSEPALAASNGLRYHNNSPFSTFDRKNDAFTQNCAANYRGGWWFNGCYFGFLTGEYFKADDKREHWRGMMWYDWKGDTSLKGAQMMIRPKERESGSTIEEKAKA